MDAIQLNATARPAGKGAARAARRNQEVPCVLYGGGLAENVTFQVTELALRPLIYTAETHTVAITVDGQTYDAILKSVVMHPVTDRAFHADFVALKRGEKLKITVPLQTRGTAPAVREGLLLTTSLHELEVTCLPKDIPGHLDVDLSSLATLTDSIRVGDLTLPDGVTTATDPDTTVVAVVAPAAEELDTPAADEAAASTETEG